MAEPVLSALATLALIFSGAAFLCAWVAMRTVNEALSESREILRERLRLLALLRADIQVEAAARGIDLGDPVADARNVEAAS